MRRPARPALASILALGLVAGASTGPAEAVTDSEPSAATALVQASGPEVAALLSEVLERSPELAAARERVAVSRKQVESVGALPDLIVGLTAFAETPETRVGPQRLMAAVSQAVPSPAKRRLARARARLEAEALGPEAETLELELLRRVRAHWIELAYLDRRRQIVERLRLHLVQHEEIARSLYATGSGTGQGVLKIQAEITRVDTTLLDLDRRRASLVARLNGLRDRPANYPLGAVPELQRLVAALPGAGETVAVQEPGSGEAAVALDRGLEALLPGALERRPELARARARIRTAEAALELAESQRRPGFRVGLTYTLVDAREDLAGRLEPPPGNGDDVLGIQGGLSLPVWRRALDAGIETAAAALNLAGEDLRSAETLVRTQIGDLLDQVPMTRQRLDLTRSLLVVQAEESRDATLSAYIAGTGGALDLLDAEHALFDAESVQARAEADLLNLLAELEVAVAAPLRVVEAPPPPTPDVGAASPTDESSLPSNRNEVSP